MIKATPLIRTSIAELLLAAAASFLGCSGDKASAPAAAPAAAAPEAVPVKPVRLAQIKGELIESKAQIVATTDSLTKLQKSSADDAQANFNAYSEQYLKLKAKAESVKARSADLKTR